MKNNLAFLHPKNKGLFFLSLGGIGEIGANCYLYGCDGKWIMIDLGLSFADEKFPGIDLLVPKIDFINDIEKNLEGIIISHGHEDHSGAVAYLANKIKCPVYATSFTKLLIENRLKEFGTLDNIDLKEIDTKNILKLKNFVVKFISTTHSIPQPNALFISTGRASYIPGDLNQDDAINVLDVVTLVNIILNVIDPTPVQEMAADINEDGDLNVLDVVMIVNLVLGG